MRNHLAILLVVALLPCLGCDGCDSSEKKEGMQPDPASTTQRMEESEQTQEQDKPEKPPLPSEWSATITGEDKDVEIGGPIVNAVERADPSGTGDATLVIQMQPEPNDSAKSAGRLIVRGFLGAKTKTGKLDVIRVDLTVPSADLNCTDADAFDVFIDEYSDFQLEGTLEGTLACKDGDTYEISGKFRD